MGLATVNVTVEPSGAAYVALVVGASPQVRTSLPLAELDAADTIAALDSIALDFDHYGRLVGVRVEGSVDSVLAPSLLEAGREMSEDAAAS